MQNEKIVAAIAAYLERETIHQNGLGRGEWVEFGGALNPASFTHAGFCQEIASEIATAIAPHMEAGADKPNWDDAPEWANWAAQDENGSWFWYENKPTKDLTSWFDKSNGNFCSVDFPCNLWGDSLHQRPG